MKHTALYLAIRIGIALMVAPDTEETRAARRALGLP